MRYLQTDGNLSRLYIPGMLAGTMMDSRDCERSVQDEEDLRSQPLINQSIEHTGFERLLTQDSVANQSSHPKAFWMCTRQ
jgi:hypothetical protein